MRLCCAIGPEPPLNWRQGRRRVVGDCGEYFRCSSVVLPVATSGEQVYEGCVDDLGKSLQRGLPERLTVDEHEWYLWAKYDCAGVGAGTNEWDKGSVKGVDTSLRRRRCDLIEVAS
jgi:hypothetical protein